MPDENYKTLREQMVKLQIKKRGVSEERVLKAMREIPRHLFVPEKQRLYAYEDCPLPIGEGQTISQPYMVALMTEALQLEGDEKVLEIGTGSGYQAAVLSKLSKEVYTIEKIKTLALKAEKLFKQLEYNNIKVEVRDGTTGWMDYSPYDAIMVTAGAPQIPEPLIEQLSDNGRIVIPVGGAFSQDLIVGKKVKGSPTHASQPLASPRGEQGESTGRRTGGELVKKVICGCMFVPLIGRYGWEK